MKTVFSNRQLAHVWAQQNQESGRGSSFYFNGATIYSYGSHFPIASFMRGSLLFNSGGYSVSTSKHINYTRQALSYEQRQSIIYLPTHLINEALRIDGYSKLNLDNMRGHYKAMVHNVAQWIENEVTSAAGIAAKRKKKSLIASDIQVALSAAVNARLLLALFKLKLPAATEKKLLALQTDIGAVIESHKKQIAAEKRKADKLAAQRAKERKEREERIAALIPVAVEKWQRAEKLESEEREAMAQTGIIYMRVNGDKVETSRGAEFPIEHAKRIFTMIRYAKENALEYIRTPENGQSNFAVGLFHVDYITAQGNVKAGCHFLEWPQIEAVARQLNIFP